MKRHLFTCIFVLASALCFAQADSDIQLYNEVRQSFSNGFYPGAVTASDKLLAKYPDSSFIHSALAYKGEALIYMESYEEAVSVLELAVSHMHSGSPEIIRCNYLLGRAFYSQKKYPAALEKFHLACSLAITNNDMTLYGHSIFYSGRAFYELEKLKEAIPAFEYVVSNGALFDSADYGEALQKLFISYNKSGAPEKTEALYKKLSEADFEAPVYLMLSFYYGDACVALKKNDEAYKAYSRVLEGEENAPEVVNKFLLRFAIDNFNAKEFDKAEKYLSDIKDSDSVDSDIRFIKNIYLTKILLERGEPKEAEKKLSGLEGFARKSETQGAQDSYYSTLLQCKIQN